MIGIDRFFCDSVWPCLYRKELFLNLPIYSNLGSLPRWVRNLKNRRFCKKLARTTFLRFFKKPGPNWISVPKIKLPNILTH